MNDPAPAADFDRPARLRDGTQVRIRGIRPDDRQRVIDAFHELEPESVYTRFFSPKKELSEADLERLHTSDFVNAAVLVATLPRDGDEVIIGGASLILQTADDGRRVAEVSFTVEEDFQGQGLSTLLMDLLVDLARQRGVVRLEADVLAGNPAMLAVFRHSGLPLRQHNDGGVVHVVMDLDTPPAAAAG